MHGEQTLRALHALLSESAQAGKAREGEFLCYLDALDRIDDPELGSELGKLAAGDNACRRDEFYAALARHPSATAISHLCGTLDAEYDRKVPNDSNQYYSWIDSAVINSTQRTMHALTMCAPLGNANEKKRAAELFVRYLRIPNCTIRRSVVRGILNSGPMVVPLLEHAVADPDEVWFGPNRNLYSDKFTYQLHMKDGVRFDWEFAAGIDKMEEWMKLHPVDAAAKLLPELRRGTST